MKEPPARENRKLECPGSHVNMNPVANLLMRVRHVKGFQNGLTITITTMISISTVGTSLAIR